jgi:type VI secretion system protein VasJ
MSIEDSVIDPVEESDLATEESVIMSMDNIVLEGDGLDMDAILNAELASHDDGVQAEKPAALQAGTTAASESEAEQNSSEIDSIPAEIEELLTPFDDQPAGTDPRYGDEFVLIKTEIDKLAFNDYSAVMTLAREILKNEGKDIRVAGYFMLANTYINGARGLIEGLILYRLLLERFGDDVYPTKESARNTSLLWLNNTKLLAYVRQSREKLKLETVQMVARQIERLNEVIVSVTNDETLCLSSLNKWVRDNIKKLDIPPPPPPQSDVKRSDSDVPAGSEYAGRPDQTIPASQAEVSRGETKPLSDVDVASSMSDTELYSLIRRIVNQLMFDGEYARGISYARAARWGGFSMPPNENGKTRITPPRQTGVNEICSLLAAGNNEEALKKCEGIFFELGGHILIDLQLYAHKAAKALGKMDLANLIAFETAAFLKRFPGIEEFRFDDDTPCAGAECLAWINKFAGGNQSGTSFMTEDEENQDLLKSINAACEEANDKDLNAGLVMLNEFRPKTEKQRYQLRLAMSQLCLDHGRAELALPMLEELTDQAERTSLAVWDVGLAMLAARQLQAALRSAMAKANEKNRMHYEQRLDDVTAQMCRWDLAQAAQFL